MLTLFRSAAIAAASILLTACAGVQYKPISVDSSFWQTREKSIATVATKVPEPNHVMLGQQGLLDLAINSANASSMKEKLVKLDTKRADQIDKNLAQRLQARGFKVTALEQRLDAEKLAKFEAPALPEIYAPFDFRSYKAQGYDYVLFINFRQVGTQRSYYGFLPLGAPLASAVVVGQLIDTRDNKLVWYGVEQSTVPIPDPWDQSPDFPNVMGAVSRNMDEVAARLERSLFAVAAAPVTPAPAGATPPAAPPASSGTTAPAAAATTPGSTASK